MSTVRGEAAASPIGQSLSAHLDRVSGKIHALVAPLTTEELWLRPFPYGNSIGHLLLHLTGNLSYYIGTQIAGTGYVRDRPTEFADASRHPKAEVLSRFDAAVEMVKATLAAQRNENWQAPYHGVGAEDVTDRLAMCLRCVAHADHHTGQMIYLCKQIALTRRPPSS
jgi:uncharacterized damage-inducible protein DinB